MNPIKFCLSTADGTVLQVYKWESDNPKAALQIVHGAAEHAMRYHDFAQVLAKSGYTVYVADHRGHGATAGKPENAGYFSDSSGGFSLVVDDIHKISELIRGENPGKPVFLLGHSMGSLLCRVCAARYREGLSGVILTGTGRVSTPLIAAVRLLARYVMAFYGRRHVSPFLHNLVFGTLNKPFKGEYGCEFICTDEAVIKAYADDEYCGNTSTAEFVFELLGGTRAAAAKKTIDGFPKSVPLLIASGEFDSMGGSGLSAVKKDVAAYRKAGVEDIKFIIYEGMRHEILNEKQKQAVYDDILSWLDSKA